MQHLIKRFVAAGGSFAVASMLLPATMTPLSAAANVDASTTFAVTELERISGEDRYETAVNISQEVFDTDHSLPYAVVVSGETHPDALAAGPLARLKGGPLLLVTRDTLPQGTADELDRVLKTNIVATGVQAQTGSQTGPAAKVIIVGGESAVSMEVEDAIKAIREEGDIETMRIEGADRYDTALNVALYMDQVRGGESSKWAFLANGDAYPDAMAASAIASNKLICDDLIPILLTREDELPASTATYLGQVALTTGSTPTVPKLEKVFVLGGEARVSQDIVDYLDMFVQDVERIAGPNRFGTASNLAETFFGVTNPPSNIGVARGDDFADALAAGPFMGKKNGPMLLVEPEVVPDETYAYVLGHKDDILGGWVLGGTNAVSDGVKSAIEAVYLD